MNPLRLDRDRCQLLVIDIQERLAPHVDGHEALIARTGALLAAARRLDIPVLLTEHCPQQIGSVVPGLRGRFEPAEIFAKTFFGAADHEEFRRLLRHGRRQVVVVGMEAHVCVMQTVLGLVELGFQPFVAEDAVGSRRVRRADRAQALERMRAAGCVLAGTETLLFEWARAGTDAAFRDTLALVKGLPESG